MMPEGMELLIAFMVLAALLGSVPGMSLAEGGAALALCVVLWAHERRPDSR